MRLLALLLMSACQLQPTLVGDADGDGWCPAPAPVWSVTAFTCEGGEFGDCDDTDPDRNPETPERCNGIDDDCDGFLADFETDGDGDSFRACEDCADDDPQISPAAAEVCNGKDDDCANGIDDGLEIDEDGDGHASPQSCIPGGDCDDTAPDVHPGRDELCDAIDHNCNGSTFDDFPAERWWTDGDGDGWGVADEDVVDLCEGLTLEGFAKDLTDCNDEDRSIHPGAVEQCNDIDHDCIDGTRNNLEDRLWWFDQDGDGAGSRDAEPVLDCAAPPQHVDNDDDCADRNPDVGPLSTETCNGIDDDCDGQEDEGVLLPWFEDLDSDGVGERLIEACEQPDGTADVGGDCDDADPLRFPGNPELCNYRDDDCDEGVDEDLLVTVYRDDDGDQRGDPDHSQISCVTEGWVEAAGDCDDTDPAVYEGAFEDCNMVDDDCDGQIDQTYPIELRYRDADGDEFGGEERVGCAEAPGWVVFGGDCDDDDLHRHPGMSETCNGVDDDCRGGVDDGLPTQEWWPDSDSDGYGDTHSGTGPICGLPHTPDLMYVDNDLDCDDSTDAVHPGIADLCNLLDDDCDGMVDEEDPSATLAYRDADFDGWGGAVVYLCEELPLGDPVPVIGRGGDCDDGDPFAFPGAPETCTRGSDCDEDTDPCTGPRFDVLRASTWRGPALLHLPSLDADNLDCPGIDHSWLAPWHGLGTSQPNLPLERYDRSNLVIQWQTSEIDSVDFPSLGLFGLPPAGQLNANPAEYTEVFAMATAQDGTEVLETLHINEVDLQFAEEVENGLCHPVPHSDIWPSDRLNGDFGGIASAASCVDHHLSEHPACAACGPMLNEPGPWSSNGQALMFDETGAAPNLGFDTKHVAWSYRFSLPTAAEIWTATSVSSNMPVRALVEFSPIGGPLCQAAGHIVPSPPRFAHDPTGVMLWKHGRADESRPAFEPVGIGGPAASVRLGIQVTTSGPAMDGASTTEETWLMCCGDGCGQCIDMDGDGWGPWCGAQDWDCNDNNANVHPGRANPALNCSSPLWWANVCP